MRHSIGTVAFMAEVVETHDLTAASQNGWAMDYRIRREDGEELHAEVRCWNKALAAAERAGERRGSRGDCGPGQRSCARVRGAGGVAGDAWRCPDLDLVRLG